MYFSLRSCLRQNYFFNLNSNCCSERGGGSDGRPPQERALIFMNQKPIRPAAPGVTHVCLIRHGQTDWNLLGKYQGREDIPLNREGEREAEAVGRYLSGFCWAAILTSPLVRARRTAQIIGRSCGLAPKEDADFIERDFGEASGMTFAQQRTAYPDGNIPGRETDAAMAVRTARAFDRILRGYPGKNILVVSHGAAINFMLRQLSKGAVRLEDMRVNNLCYNLAEHDGKDWHVTQINARELDDRFRASEA